MPTFNKHYDWQEIARLALISRKLDELEEAELTPEGLVIYQFSARGHELGQLLLAQQLTYPMDGFSSYYRSRPAMLGLGLTLEEAINAGMARQNSPSGGRDVGVVFNMPPRGRATVIPAAADVGSQYTPAAGWAQAIQYRVNQLGETDKKGSIAVVCGGDGSIAANGFWSALTMATTLNLPLLFFIEDNQFAISVRDGLQTPGGNIAPNLKSFGNLLVKDGDGTDPAEASKLVKSAVDHVRKGKGPCLLRLSVPRLSGHSSADNAAYKTESERERDHARDPLPKLRDYLITHKVYTKKSWQALEEEIAEECRTTAKKATQNQEPLPETVTDYAFFHTDQPAKVGGLIQEEYQHPTGTTTPDTSDPRRINMVQAVNRVLDGELSQNPYLIVFGEDVGRKGGVHIATVGLHEKYGEARVFDTSLSEEGIIGRAAGMAYAGLCPVPEIQFRKYADPATEQLHNIGTARWRSHNNFQAPVVVRVPGGFGRKVGDPWHSVSNEVMFAHATGWQVVYPSNAEDCVGLLRTALRSENPTFFFEHRAQLDAAWARRPYPGDDYIIPFGKGRLITEGTDLTVVSWGAMVERCDFAARDIEGASIEVIDLRTVMPWDKPMVLESVRKTSKCLIVHEDAQIAGFGAEISATIVSEAFLDLDAPVERIAPASVPVPFNVNLMHEMVPSIEKIRIKMIELLEY